MKSSIQREIFRTYFLLITIPVVLVMLTLFVIISHNNLRSAIFLQREEVLHSVNLLNQTLSSMHLIADQVNASDTIRDIFVTLENDDFGNAFDEDNADTEAILSILKTINSTNYDSVRISITNEYGDYIGYGFDEETSAIIMETLDTEKLPVQCEYTLSNAEGNGAISGPHPVWNGDDSPQAISYITYLSSEDGTENYGYIQVDIFYDAITDLDFMQMDENGCYYLLIDNFGRIGANPAGDANLDMSDLYEELTAELGPLISGRTVHTQFEVNGVDSDVFATYVVSSEWILVRVLEKGVLTEIYATVYISMFSGMLILLLILTLVAYHMSGSVAKPLLTFANTVNQVTLSRINLPALPADPNPTDELDVLNRCFRSMMQKIDTSVKLEMTAQLKALQSQMDPHFLFNMLTVISEAAEVDESMTTVDMCDRLSMLLRYVANHESLEVSLHDEIEHLRIYLELMHDRYTDDFTFEIHENEEMMGISIPRTVLQPFAENSFQHGFKKVDVPWKITVDMEMDETTWRVMISDNGGGMEPGEIEMIYRRIEAFSNTATNDQSLHIGGMGILNTVQRMKIMDPTTIFIIENLPQGGTRITIGGSV